MSGYDSTDSDEVREFYDKMARERGGDEQAVLAAMAAGRYQEVEALVGARPALAKTTCPKTFRPLLHMAAAKGQLGLMQMLVSHGASVGARDDTVTDPFAPPYQGQTAMLAAAEAGQTAAVCWLLDHGAKAWEAGSPPMTFHDEEETDWGGLHHAAWRGDATLAAALLWRGADPTAITCPSDQNALEIAADRAHLGSAGKQAERRRTAHLLLWAGAAPPDYMEGWLKELEGQAPAPLPREALRFAPPGMKACCRTALLCMRKLAWPAKAVQGVVGACQLAWMQHEHSS